MTIRQVFSALTLRQNEMLMEGGIWYDDVYAFSSSEKTFICFSPRQGPEFRLVIFLLMNSQSRVVKSGYIYISVRILGDQTLSKVGP
jgi:hypothetical protein